MARPVPFISRVRLKNFKSIAACDVRLSPFTVLVGPNASGKSNFLAGLSFMARAVETSPYQAVVDFGGLERIVRWSAGSFSVGVEASVPWGTNPDQWATAQYGFEIGPSERYRIRPFEVINETCELYWKDQVWQFRVQRGVVLRDMRARPAPRIESDRLYLPIAAVDTTFGPLHGHLASMQFYEDFYLAQTPTPSVPGAMLGPHGEHLGDVLAALSIVRPELKDRIDSYLRAISPGVQEIDPLTIGDDITVAFLSRLGGDGVEVEFGPSSASSGTVHVACVLAALFQLPAVDGRISLIGIDEPGAFLHPAAAGVLLTRLARQANACRFL